MPRKLKVVLVAVALAALPAIPAHASSLLTNTGFGTASTTITFDSPSLPAGTIVSNQFAGASFSATGASNFRYAGNPGAYSGDPNFGGGYLDSFTGGQGVNNSNSTFTIKFNGPVNRAGAFFEFNASAPAVTLTAFNGSSVVDSFSYDNPSCCSSPQFLGFQGVTFNSIQLSGITVSDFITDNLRFDSTAAVPEPTTWALMLLGFGMIGFAVRKRSNVRTTVSYA